MAFAIAALALLYAPITDDFAFSQRQTLIPLLLVLVMRALDKRREAAAGLLLGLAVAYRAFPALIAGYFVIRRQWRPLIFMGVGLAIVGAVTIAGLGLAVCMSYLHGMNFAMSSFKFGPTDVSLRGFLIRLFAYAAGLQPNSRLQLLQRITITSAEIVVVALTAWPTYQRRQLAGFDRRAYGLWVAAAIVLSPLSWIHYMVLLLIPFVEIAGSAERQTVQSTGGMGGDSQLRAYRDDLWSARGFRRCNMVGARRQVPGRRTVGRPPARISRRLLVRDRHRRLAGRGETGQAPPAFAPSHLSPAQIVSLRSAALP